MIAVRVLVDGSFFKALSAHVARRDAQVLTGSCDVSDDRLLARTMPIGRAVGPGDSSEFTGASIGFNDKSSNQDTFQGAVIGLTYASSLAGRRPGTRPSPGAGTLRLRSGK